MLFDELNITNFGIYKGEHSVDLLPRDGKPIILFGGLNGGGKTTLLDALQLVLYGRHAKTSNRGRLSYEDYLRETINRYAKKQEAMLELYFWHFNEGRREKYQITRQWQVTGKSVKESLFVSKNGQEESVLSEHWDEYVNDFIPANISSLFFFDGEKIESLADARKSAGLIKTGIHALLGLDVVDNLARDLGALKNRRKIKQQTTEVQEEIEGLQKRKAGLVKACQPLIAQRSLLLSDLKDAVEIINEKWLDFKRNGGELYDQQKELRNKHSVVEAEMHALKERLRKYAEGAAPLLLVKDLLFKAKVQAEKEEKGKVDQAMLQSLSIRDTNLLNQLVAGGVDDSVVQMANSYMEKDRQQRQAQIPEMFYLNVPVEAFHGLDEASLTAVKREGNELKTAYHLLEEKLARLDTKLSAVPEEAIIANLHKAINEAEEEKKKYQAQIELLDSQLSEREQEIDQMEVAVSRKLSASSEKGFDIERQMKVLEQADNIRDVLADFRLVLIKEDIHKLERLILESFNVLIRKDDLISKITIDTETYRLNLYGKDEQLLKPTRLSAGERQLLAISILWGLAKASGRPLPAIIDTPLGRLDSRHRSHLIDNYFPYASHQVILLSTDQEIDCEYRDELKKYIATEYHIEYREDIKSSTITEGYF